MRQRAIDQFRNQLSKLGVNAEAAELWTSFIAPAVLVRIDEASSGQDLPLGSSKIGGRPHLPAGMDWPKRKAYFYDPDPGYLYDSHKEPSPLYFLAQLNLSDLAALDVDPKLPSTGLMLFFYDLDVQPMGFDPKDKAGSLLLFFTDLTDLHEADVPTGFVALNEYPVNLVQDYSIPGAQSFRNQLELTVQTSPNEIGVDLSTLDLDWDELSSTGKHMVGGWPPELQGEMRHQCSFVSDGLNVGSGVNREEIGPDRFDNLLGKMLDWKCLMRFDTDDRVGLMFGDMGKLFFWCRDEDIAARRFDRSMTILQCF